MGRLEGSDETVDVVYEHLGDAHMGLSWGGWGTFVDVEIRGDPRLETQPHSR